MGFRRSIMETLINWLCERITSLCGTRFIAYLVDMYRLLRSMYLVLHFIRRINQRFFMKPIAYPVSDTESLQQYADW